MTVTAKPRHQSAQQTASHPLHQVTAKAGPVPPECGSRSRTALIPLECVSRINLSRYFFTVLAAQLYKNEPHF